MNTEIIKIEPPIVVKEELKVDNNKNIEMKLENEEKPQLVGDIMSEENKPSTSEIVGKDEYDFDEPFAVAKDKTFGIKLEDEEKLEHVEEFILKENELSYVETVEENKNECAYCGESNISQDMTKVPQNRNALRQWGRILGEEFYMRAQSGKTTYICRSHFDVKWGYMRPDYVLPCVGPVQFSLHEVKEEAYSKVKSFNLFMKDPTPVQKKNWTLNKNDSQENECSYCGESNISQDMTKVPQNRNALRQWGRILGEEFYMRAQSTKTNFICRSHFDVEWENIRPDYVLPCVEPVQLSLHEGKENTYSTVNLSTCCCCGETKSLMEMVETPATVEELAEWYRILGENFYKNSQNSKSSMVCRSHFDDDMLKKKQGELSPISFSDENSRVYNETRIVKQYQKVDIKKPSTILCVCAYCGVRKPIRIMTTIPYDPNTLRQWGQILGERFYRNALADRYSSICRSHFNVEWIHIRPRNFLPRAACVTSDQAICDNSKIMDVELEESEMKDDSDKKSVHLHDKHIKTQIQSQEFDMKLNKNLEVPKYIKQDERKIKKPYTIMCLCAYCGETKPIHVMTMIPCDPNTLLKWGQILGEDFYKNALADENSFICRSHFNAEWSYNRPHYILPHAMNENCNKNSEIPKYINQNGHSDRKKIKLETNEAK